MLDFQKKQQQQKCCLHFPWKTNCYFDGASPPFTITFDTWVCAVSNDVVDKFGNNTIRVCIRHTIHFFGVAFLMELVHDSVHNTLNFVIWSSCLDLWSVWFCESHFSQMYSMSALESYSSFAFTLINKSQCLRPFPKEYSSKTTVTCTFMPVNSRIYFSQSGWR